jgi:endonuclease III
MASLRSEVEALRVALRRAPGTCGFSDHARPGGGFESIVRELLRELAPRALADAMLARLAEAGLTDPATLADADPAAIATELDAPLAQVGKWLRPLRSLARRVADAGGMEAVEEMPTQSLRESWSDIRGLGPKTLDVILLRGLRRAVYPVDRSTFRILARHGWLEGTETYDEAREVVEASLPEQCDEIAEFAGWMEQIGKSHCLARRPKCERCILRDWLPPGGPLGFDAE